MRINGYFIAYPVISGRFQSLVHADSSRRKRLDLIPVNVGFSTKETSEQITEAGHLLLVPLGIVRLGCLEKIVQLLGQGTQSLHLGGGLPFFRALKRKIFNLDGISMEL